MKIGNLKIKSTMIKVLSLAVLLFGFSPMLFAKEDPFNQVFKALEVNENPEAIVPCAIENYPNAICVVFDKVTKETKTTFHKRSLIVFDSTDENIKKIFRYDQDEYSGLLSIAVIDSSLIVLTWESGSGQVITIFKYVDNGLKLVLETGSKFSPEFINSNEIDGTKEILISSGKSYINSNNKRIFGPTKTSVYKFQKDKYVKFMEVPYNDRFKVFTSK